MATLIQIRNKVDTFLADLWVSKLVPKQEAYFARHGRYAQVLISPEALVSDGAESIFVKRPPSDEKNPNDFDFTIDVPIPMQIVIDTHDRGELHGFTVTATVEVLGKKYSRSKNYKFGGVDAGWHETINEEI